MYPRRKRDIFSEDIWDSLNSPPGDGLVQHPRQRPKERVERLSGAHGLEHDDVSLVAVGLQPHPSQGCESRYAVDDPPVRILLELDLLAVDLHVIPALSAEVGSLFFPRKIDNQFFKRDYSTLGRIAYHDSVSGCHAHFVEYGRELSGGDGAVKQLIDFDGSRSTIQFPIHLLIEGALIYMINSKKTYLHGVAGLADIWAPVRVSSSFAARADLLIRFPRITWYLQSLRVI